MGLSAIPQQWIEVINKVSLSSGKLLKSFFQHEIRNIDSLPIVCCDDRGYLSLFIITAFRYESLIVIILGGVIFGEFLSFVYLLYIRYCTVIPVQSCIAVGYLYQLKQMPKASGYNPNPTP